MKSTKADEPTKPSSSSSSSSSSSYHHDDELASKNASTEIGTRISGAEPTITALSKTRTRPTCILQRGDDDDDDETYRTSTATRTRTTRLYIGSLSDAANVIPEPQEEWLVISLLAHPARIALVRNHWDALLSLQTSQDQQQQQRRRRHKHHVWKLYDQSKAEFLCPQLIETLKVMHEHCCGFSSYSLADDDDASSSSPVGESMNTTAVHATTTTTTTRTRTSDDADDDDDDHHHHHRRRPILVHCNRGKSRSAAVLCAYLMVYHSTEFPTVEAAMTQIRMDRPTASPNLGFIAALKAIERAGGNIPLAIERWKNTKREYEHKQTR